MECWNDGALETPRMLRFQPIIPGFQYSVIPMFVRPMKP